MNKLSLFNTLVISIHREISEENFHTEFKTIYYSKYDLN